MLCVLLWQKTCHKVLCGTFQMSRFISDSNITFHISVMLSFLKIGVVQGEAKGGGLFSARSSHGQDRQNAVPRFSPGLGRHHKGNLCLSLCTTVPLWVPLSLPITRTSASQTHPHPLPLPLPHTHTCTRAPARTRPCIPAGVRTHKHTFSLTLN